MSDIWTIFSIAAKFVLYFSVLMSCGAILFRMVFREAEWASTVSLRPTIIWATVFGLAATILNYALRGAALSGDAAGMTDPEILRLLWDTPVGSAFLFRVSGLGMIITSLLFPRGGRFLAILGVALAIWSFGEIGHALEFEKPWLAMLLSVHLVAVAFWIGALSPLRCLAADPHNLPEAADLAHRFGIIASAVVPVLILAGSVFAWYLTGSWAALFGTSYGWTLLLKIALVGGLLGFAALNKIRLVPAMQAGDPEAAQKLRRSISMEWAVIAAILLVTATLTSVMALPNAA